MNDISSDSEDKKPITEEEAVKKVVEPQRWLMLTLLLPTAGFFFGGWFIVMAFFGSYVDRLEKESIANYGYEPDKLKQMKYETNILTTYGYESSGKMRIPIERAMEMTIRRYEQNNN